MEWSTLHIPFNHYTMVDLDGVISQDWTGLRTEGEHEAKYRKHVTEAHCLIHPSYPIHSICTSRLEKWRPETEAWLKRNGIKYGKLLMNPATSCVERVKTDGFAGWKTRAYLSHPDARLFIESSKDQAQAIAWRSEKPVLDWSTPYLYQPKVNISLVFPERVTPVDYYTIKNKEVTVNTPASGLLDPIRLPI